MTHSLISVAHLKALLDELDDVRDTSSEDPEDGYTWVNGRISLQLQNELRHQLGMRLLEVK